MDILLDGLEKIGVADFYKKAAMLKLYISEILAFNPTLKLVGDKDEEDIIIRHILDSAVGYSLFLEYTKEGDIIADLGSGSGLPGIVLAILLEDRNFVLVERMKRRVGFLRGVVARLKLDNVRIEEKDIKDIGEKYNALTCRAFHPLSDIAKDSIKILDSSGYALMYKGQRKSVDSELGQMSANGYTFNADIERLDVPYLNEERVMCVLSGWRKK